MAHRVAKPLRGDTRMHAPDRRHVKIVALLRLESARRHRVRHPEIRRAWISEILGHDSDDLIRAVVEHDRLPEHAEVAGEVLAPHAVAEHDHSMAARFRGAHLVKAAERRRS